MFRSLESLCNFGDLLPDLDGEMGLLGLSGEGLGSAAVGGVGLPDIMAAHRASTSTVAALVSARGFFSIFLWKSVNSSI